MKEYNVTPYQELLLLLPGPFKNYTIDMAIKLNCHLDNDILVQAVNKEIERNEGLRLRVIKKVFKYRNTFLEPYTVNDIHLIDLKSKTEEEVKKHIDKICENPMKLLKSTKPFELYQIVCDDGDYLLLRVFHVNMDAYAVFLTLSDLLKVYYSIFNNEQINDNLTSVEEYISKYEKNISLFKAKEKEDNEYFINHFEELGEPTYLGCEGSSKNRKHKYLGLGLKINHPCAYGDDNISSNLANICNEYCQKNNINLTSLLLSLFEIYYSAVNDNSKDITFSFTSNFRGKLSEKKLPLTSSSAILFRRIIDLDLSLDDFIKNCNNDYINDLKHWRVNAITTGRYINKYNKSMDLYILYNQLAFAIMPVNFDGIDDDVEIKPYWPKTKKVNDFEIYLIFIMNKDGSYDISYRYMNEYTDSESISKLLNGARKMIPYLNEPSIKVKDLINRL